MNDKEAHEISVKIDLLAKSVAQQQLVLMRLMANHHAGMALMRHSMVESGYDRQKLNQQYHTAYDSAWTLYREQIARYDETGDAIAFLSSLIFPDEIQSN